VLNGLLILKSHLPFRDQAERRSKRRAIVPRSRHRRSDLSLLLYGWEESCEGKISSMSRVWRRFNSRACYEHAMKYWKSAHVFDVKGPSIHASSKRRRSWRPFPRYVAKSADSQRRGLTPIASVPEVKAWVADVVPMPDRPDSRTSRSVCEVSSRPPSWPSRAHRQPAGFLQ
jgi:hypothetical protein